MSKMHTSELSRLVSRELFEKEYRSFIIQAEKNAITTKPNKDEMSDGFPYTRGNMKIDGGNVGCHLGQGRAGKTPYINWHVVSVYYVVDEARIVIGIEEDRYWGLYKMQEHYCKSIGNKNNVAIFYEVKKEAVNYGELYDKFLDVSEEVMRIGL